MTQRIRQHWTGGDVTLRFRNGQQMQRWERLCAVKGISVDVLGTGWVFGNLTVRAQVLARS